MINFTKPKYEGIRIDNYFYFKLSMKKQRINSFDIFVLTQFTVDVKEVINTSQQSFSKQTVIKKEDINIKL